MAAWDQRWDKAALAYQQALEEIPNDPKALTSLGLALYELQRYDESPLAYQQAAQVVSNDPIPQEKVGQLLERLGKNKEAIQAFLRADGILHQNQDLIKPLKIGGTSHDWIRNILPHACTWRWFTNELVIPHRLPTNIWRLPAFTNVPGMQQKRLK